MAIDEKDISQRVRHVIDKAQDEERLVGAVVLVAHDGEIVHRQAAGFADREAQQPMQENTIFRFASLSKPVVSAAGMALVERGTLALDDRATDWLPEFRPRAPSGQEACITVRTASSDAHSWPHLWLFSGARRVVPDGGHFRRNGPQRNPDD